MQKKKVLFLITKFDGYYSPSYAELLRQLDTLGFEVKMCYLSGLPVKKGTEPWKAIYLEEFVGVDAGSLARFKVLRKVLSEEAPDILHCHRHGAAVYGAFASFFFPRMRVISHVHGMKRTRNLKRRLTNVFVNSRLSAIVAISEAVRKDIIENNFLLNSSKVVVAYNGIISGSIKSSAEDRAKARKNLGISEEINAFITVGRLMPTKGQKFLIEAFADISASFPHARLFLAGQGPLKEELEGLVKKLGISGKVVFLGFRSDIGDILCAFDFYVFPSVMEGLGLSLIEAMSAGLYSIASDVGGIPEVLGGNGRLVRPSNAEELKEAMGGALRMSAEEKARIAESGRVRSEKLFTVDAMARSFAEVYLKALGA